MEYGEPLANVEPPAFEVLGYIPVQGDELLASLQMESGVAIPPAAPVEQQLPQPAHPALKSVFPMTEMPAPDSEQP
jgi:hypothetical protein